MAGPCLLARIPSTQWRGPGARPWRSGWASSSLRRARAAGRLWAPSSSRGWPRQISCCSRPGQRAAAKPCRIAASLTGQPCSARARSIPNATAPLLACTAPGSPRGQRSRSSGSSQRSSAPTAAARAFNTAATSGLWGALMATAPGWSTPAFSAAMWAGSGPRNSAWSSPTEAKPITGRWGWQVVASSLPPSPTSSTTSSRFASAKARKAAAVTSSNGVSWWRWATGVAVSRCRRRSGAAIGASPRRMRSVQLTRWGEV